jgi:hypothetical protein
LLETFDEPTLAGDPFAAEARPLSSRRLPSIAGPQSDELTQQYEPDKLTGARNEDSVLFSLDKLSDAARATAQAPEPSLLDDFAQTRQVAPPSEVLEQLRVGSQNLAETRRVGGVPDDLAQTRQLHSDQVDEALLGPKSGPPPGSARLAPPAAFSATLPLTPAPVLPDMTMPSASAVPPVPPQNAGLAGAGSGGYPAAGGAFPAAPGNAYPAAQSGGYPSAAGSGGYPIPNTSYPPAGPTQPAPAKKSGMLIWLLLLVFVLMIACTLVASYLLKMPANLYGPNGQPKLPF